MCHTAVVNCKRTSPQVDRNSSGQGPENKRPDRHTSHYLLFSLSLWLITRGQHNATFLLLGQHYPCKSHMDIVLVRKPDLFFSSRSVTHWKINSAIKLLIKCTVSGKEVLKKTWLYLLVCLLLLSLVFGKKNHTIMTRRESSVM